MENLLEVGVSSDVDIQVVLLGAVARMRSLGYSIDASDFECEYGLFGKKTLVTNEKLVVRPGGIHLLYQRRCLSIFITVSQSEIVEGYSNIFRPVTVGVSVWVGADIFEKTMAACLAISIASCEGSEIIDMEHVWTDRDVSQVEDFGKKIDTRIS